MTLSVVVASHNSPATLERCLEALPQDLEVIVADCSDQDPAPRLASRFPRVRFVHFAHSRTIPQLRREGFRLAQGDVVAFTEARLAPSGGWTRELLEAHRRHAEAPAIGGPIDHAPKSIFDTAAFFCEYGWHMPPTGDGEAAELSGANVSYKRWALEACRDLVEAGAWEPFLHRRLKQQGGRLLRAGRALVCYHNSLGAGEFLRQRFHYGRWFAAARVQSAPLRRRLFRAASCPLLPALLTARLAALVVKRRRHRLRFLAALPWIGLCQTAWAAGEFCGYVLGKGGSDRVVF